MKWDLVQLYSQLGLQPDCTLEEFKRTYRRRIAELHPDKGTDAGASEVRLLLPELIWLYATATRFHRRHGRLPGAVPMRGPGGSGSQPAGMPMKSPADSLADSRPVPSRSSTSSQSQETPPRRGFMWAILLLVLLLLLTLPWGRPTPDPRRESALGTAHIAPVAANALTDQLELGMDEANVLAIQGEPLLASDTRWDYGPSWLAFEEGHLVDWHSSPLHQLRTATPSPAPAAGGIVEPTDVNARALDFELPGVRQTARNPRNHVAKTPPAQ